MNITDPITSFVLAVQHRDFATGASLLPIVVMLAIRGGRMLGGELLWQKATTAGQLAIVSALAAGGAVAVGLFCGVPLSAAIPAAVTAALAAKLLHDGTSKLGDRLPAKSDPNLAQRLLLNHKPPMP